MRFSPDRRTSLESPARDRARDLRRAVMIPEKKLWNQMKNRKCGGLKFRRQHPIGPYTADFFCAEAGLVVELDGAVHEREQAKDLARDEFMRSLDLESLRTTVARFERHPEGVVETIRKAAERRTKKTE